jgi:serine/threonine-protein kinase RsbW
METISLTLPSQPEYVTVLRLVTASCAQILDFDVEAVDDLRVCVSEAVNYLIADNEEIHVDFEMEADQLAIRIQAENPERGDDQQELHQLILESLMDQVSYGPGEMLLIKKRA